MNRTIAPEIKPSLAFNTGFVESHNNLFHFNANDGVFKLDIVYPNANRVGVKNTFAYTMAMDLILSGTEKLTASQISETIDSFGGFVFKSSDYYSSSIAVYGLEENIEAILNVLKNAIDNVIFPLEEIDIYKRNKISELNINLEKTSFLANRGINKMLFGENHSAAKVVSEEVITNTNQQELLDFKIHQLQNPYFIFTGSKNIAIQSILEKNGFSISVFNKINKADEVPQSVIENETIIKKQNSTQSSLRMGCILPNRKHKDYFKLSVLNTILGGYFGSRLMKNIREEKGLTYGINSSIVPYKDFSVLKISSECNNQNTELVKQEILKEIEILKTELIGNEELTTVKNYLSGVLQRNFDGIFNISDRFKSYLDMDTEKMYFHNYLNAVQSITPQEIIDTAHNYFTENTFKYCLAG